MSAHLLPRIQTDRCPTGPRAGPATVVDTWGVLKRRTVRRRAAVGLIWLVWLVWLTTGLTLLPQPARADVPEITSFELLRQDDGLQLSFAVRFELSRGLEDALLKGVPLYFVADAELLRDRWYWFDRRVGKTSRTWRLTYQPLTRKYRVSLGGLNQSFDSLTDALYSVRRATGWKIAEPSQIEDGSRHYVEFSYRLDTNLLPRPLQIGISGQPDWTLMVEKFQRFN